MRDIPMPKRGPGPLPCEMGRMCFVRCPECAEFDRIKIDLTRGAERLGADFEKVWDDNAKELYEP
jgi:hypothetical protein